MMNFNIIAAAVSAPCFGKFTKKFLIAAKCRWDECLRIWPMVGMQVRADAKSASLMGRMPMDSFSVEDANYSPGMIASLGQTSAQEPQSMQVSGSM